MDNNLHTHAQCNVTFHVEGREDGQGYIAQTNSIHGLIVIQEWWGLNQTMVNKTNLFAKKGFQAIAPDIYRGKIAKNQEEAGHLLSGLDWEGAVQDIAGAAKRLRLQGCKKIGITGFCMGGALAIAAISAHPDLINASAPFYGVCDLEKFSLQNINGPIYGQFGEQDALNGFSSPADAQRLVEAGQKYGKDVRVKMWPGAGHAFMNPDRPEAYRAETAEQALDEVVKFFKETFAHK